MHLSPSVMMDLVGQKMHKHFSVILPHNGHVTETSTGEPGMEWEGGLGWHEHHNSWHPTDGMPIHGKLIVRVPCFIACWGDKSNDDGPNSVAAAYTLKDFVNDL